MKKPIVISGISTTPKNVPSLSEEAPPVVVGIPSKDQSAAYAQEAKTAAELAEKYAEEASQTSQEAVEIHNASPDAHSTLFSQKLTTPEGGLPGQVLVKTEEGEGWGDVSSTSIDGVSGEINLSDGLEIDSETKTMGIGNAAVQSLTIADGGITQDIDVSLGGKAFFIGKNTTPVTDSNYYFAYQFSHGGAYLQAKRIDSRGGIYTAGIGIFGNIAFYDGTFNISNRITSFTCGAPFTQNGISTFNGIASFNNDVTRKTKLSPLAEDVMNKQMVDTAIADAGGHTTIDGVAGDILLSDGITIDPNTKTLGLGDIVADSVNLPNADSTVTLNGSILSGSHGVKDIALLNEYGIGLISSVPEYNQLAIGGDKVLDMGYGRCVDRLSLLALGCGINLMPGGIFVNGAMWKGTSGTKGRYLASKENESVSGDWTFNANAIFNSSVSSFSSINVESGSMLTFSSNDGTKSSAALMGNDGILYLRNGKSGSGALMFRVSSQGEFGTNSISNTSGIYHTPKGTKIYLGDYVAAPTVADAGKRFLEITNQSSASLATEFSTKVVTSTGSFSSETYSIFKDSFLEGNSITANVNLLVKGASTLRGVSTFNGAVIANAGLTNTTGIFYTPARAIIAMGDVVTNPTIADAGKSWFEIYPFSVTSRLLRGKSINAEGNIISEPLYADSFTLVDQLASEANFALKGQFVTYSTGLTNIDLKDANGRQVIFLDASTSTPILRFGSSANALNTTSNAYEVSLYGRQAGIYTQGSSLVVNSGDLKKMGHGVYTCASLANSITGSWAFNAPQTFNAGIVNTTGTFLLPNKQNRFGQYVENPTIDDASKGWLMLEHSVNTGIDITLYAEYVSSTGSVAGGQIRFGSAVVCNTSLLVFDNADFRSTLRVGGDIRALAGNIITPMSTTPTRIGDYVANPSTADAGKLWIEIAKKDGYIELSGKEVVNTNGTVSVQDYPVRIPGMIRYEELTEAEFAALPRPLPQDVIYRTTQN